MKTEATTTATEPMHETKKKEHDKMDHIKDYFAKEFSDEMHGCNEYADLAMIAEEHGDRRLAMGLYEMSKDEYTHAKFIHDHLIEWGCEIPETEVAKYHQTKERIMRIFR